MIFAESAAVPVFRAMNPGILSVPDIGVPVAGLLLVHEYVVPARLPLKIIVFNRCPEQIT